MQNKQRWYIFLSCLVVFIVFVELLYRSSKDKDSIYQCRILIDKDFSVDESGPEEEVKSEKISLYTRTKYGVLPRRQSDYLKIFKAYSSSIDYVQENDSYVKLAVVVQAATTSNIQGIIAKYPDQKFSFVIPYYVNDLNKIAEIIISAGHEFFLQLPTQSSIPAYKKDVVSPFLANSSEEEIKDKLSYLIASVKYAIGIANTSESLITKSRKDMNIISKELSQRGMAFLNIYKEGDVEEIIDTPLLFLKARNFRRAEELKNKDTIIIDSNQLEVFQEMLPKDMKVVPMSFGADDASI